MVLRLHCLFYTLVHIGGISDIQRVIAERFSKSRQAVLIMVDMVFTRVSAAAHAQQCEQ